MVEYAADSCSKGSKLFFVNKYGEILDLERGGEALSNAKAKGKTIGKWA